MIDSDRGTGNRGLQPDSSVLRQADVARMVAQHATLRHLCGALETCADRLPDRGAVVEAARISAALVRALSDHIAVAKWVLNELSIADGTGTMEMPLRRIRYRHAMDLLHAEDLHEALAAAADTLGPIRFDTLSYMMRCLFDGCRRAIDFQEAAILMCASDRMAPDARAIVTASLTRAD